MISARAAATSARQGSGVATVTRPAPERSAPAAASTAAPGLAERAGDHEHVAEVALVGAAGAAREGGRRVLRLDQEQRRCRPPPGSPAGCRCRRPRAPRRRRRRAAARGRAWRPRRSRSRGAGHRPLDALPSPTAGPTAGRRRRSGRPPRAARACPRSRAPRARSARSAGPCRAPRRRSGRRPRSGASASGQASSPRTSTTRPPAALARLEVVARVALDVVAPPEQERLGPRAPAAAPRRSRRRRCSRARTARRSGSRPGCRSSTTRATAAPAFSISDVPGMPASSIAWRSARRISSAREDGDHLEESSSTGASAEKQHEPDERREREAVERERHVGPRAHVAEQQPDGEEARDRGRRHPDRAPASCRRRCAGAPAPSRARRRP